MKTLKESLTATLLLSAAVSLGQVRALTFAEMTEKTKIENTTKQYKDDIAKILKKKLIDEQAKTIPNAEKIAELKTDIDKRLFNPKMMNILFAKEVAANFNGSSDLTLNRYYASLDADDTSLSFGFTIDPRGENKFKKLNYVYNAGFKMKAEDGYGTIAKDGEMTSSDLGVTLKATKIFGGNIGFGTKTKVEEKNGKIVRKTFNRKEIVKKYRDALLTQYDKKIAEYTKGNFITDLDSLSIVNDATNNSFVDPAEELSTFGDDKRDEFYSKIAEAEIDFFKENKLYRYITDHYLSLELFVPIAEKKYNILANSSTADLSEKQFYPFKGSIMYTYFVKYSANKSLYISPQFSVFNNNNILADELTTVPLETITSYPTSSQQAVTKSDDVYVETFDQFLTSAAKIEVASFLINNRFGLSASLEKNFGEYDPLNWKLGLPISLKDEEDKPLVNFELQWKEVNGSQVFGVSASLVFGTLIR